MAPVVLASGQSVQSFTVDGANVYWVFQGSASPLIAKCAISGCNKDPLTITNAIWAQGSGSIASDGTYIYYNTLDYEGVLKCPIDGCSTPTGLGSGITNPGLAIDPLPGNVYFTEEAPGEIGECPAATGCSSTPRSTPSEMGEEGPPMASDGNFLYFVGSSSVMQCAVPGLFSCKTMGTGPATSLATDGHNVYWSGQGSVWACPAAGCTTPTALAQSRTGSLALATDGTYVYWTESEQIVRCATGGCGGSPTLVVTTQSAVAYLAVDSQNLYWVDSGNVVKLPKP
jgi:hypothetical protein